MNNILFCDKNIYDSIRNILEDDLNLNGYFVPFFIDDGNIDPLSLYNLAKDQGYICIATKYPKLYHSIFPNAVVDVNIHQDNYFKLAKEISYYLTNFGREKPMTNSTFFTSDTHFYHENIIKYCSRPFSSVDEMNKAMIDNWNNVVGKNDIVWHLGDFCFGKKDNIMEIFPKLNGKINLVMGNHDH